MLDRKAILIGYSERGFIVGNTAIENQSQLIGYTDIEIVQNNSFGLHYLGNEKRLVF